MNFEYYRIVIIKLLVKLRTAERLCYYLFYVLNSDLAIDIVEPSKNKAYCLPSRC